ncbi:MFS transporter [Parvularcula sp. ZS-1/3]|uniref:MFS transporter n=1 Tax=Parvularcula mediterranea TaxID=2732508 RepID=A0A7Y3W695_9PROT|nr:MFS transporter [Parvularcula mediterranea]NNU17288.1 MFS transporter [Parvularcula mediterranea]
MSDTQSVKAPSEDPKGWLWRSVKPYTRPEMAAMLMLGFASGLPLYLVYQKTAFWLREEGIELSTIGYFYWLGLFYSFKFVWAPIIDRLNVPGLTKKLGHRRSWMIVSIIGTMAGLSIAAFSDPSEGLTQIILGTLILAFSGATLDVSIDAWRIESAPSEEQASMAASYSLGYRGALIFSGLALVLASWSSWTVSYLVMAAAMGTTAALVLIIREPKTVKKQIALSDLPLFAGPAQAAAVALFLFGFAKVFVWMNFAEILVHLLAGAAIGALALGKIAFKGTKMDLPWRAALAGLGALYVYSRPVLESTVGLPANEQFAKLAVVALTIAALAGLVMAMVKASQATEGNLNLQDPEAKRGRVFMVYAPPLLQVIDRFGKVIVPIFILVLIYRLSDFTMGVMAVPLYVDLGFDKGMVGAIQSGPGVISTFIGLFLGGLAAGAFGITRSLVFGAILTLVTNGAYAWFAGSATGDDIGFLTFAICADNVAGGFVTTVFIAYLSSLVDPANAATQYALFSSIYATLNKFVAGFSGQMAEALGWVNFFLLTASYAIPAGLLVILVAVLQKRYPPKPVAAVGEPAT